MNIKSVVLLLFLYSSFQAFVLGIVFLLKKENKDANRLFAVFMFLFSFHLLFNFLNWRGYIDTVYLIFLSDLKPLVWLLYGPLLYLYFCRLLLKKKAKTKELLHLLPVLLFYLACSKYIFISSEEKILQSLQGNGVHIPLYLYFLVFASLLGYLIATYNLLFVKSRFGEPYRIWINWIYFSFASYVLAVTMIFTLVFLKYIKINDQYEYLVGFIIILPIWVVSYFAYIQPGVFAGRKVLSGFPFLKYQKSGLTKRYSTELKKDLLRLMEEEKLYLNNELNLNLISERLHTSRHNASQIINEHFQLNFHEFVNKFRIEEAKEILRKDQKQNLSVVEVGYEVGFNSKTTFFSRFKEETGLTPSEYRDQLN